MVGFRLSRRAAVLAAGIFLAFPAVSLAATYTVNTTADNAPNSSECSGAPGDCSIRQAMDKATSGDTVDVPANTTDYQVTVTPVAIPAGVSLVGGGASGTIVTGGSANQIFTVNSGGSVSISAITLTDGHNNSGSDEAGALWITDGDVTLDQVAITDSSSPEYGGAIEDDGGNLTITRSRFIGNTSGDEGGGAIDYYDAGALSVSDTEFAGNSSGSYAGAIFVESEPTSVAFNRVTFDSNSATGSDGGALEIEACGGSSPVCTAPASFYNVTFTHNSAATGTGGAMYVSDTSSVTAVNDTFASNSAPTGADVENSGGTYATQNSIYATPSGGGSSCDGTITDSGNNLEDASTSSCGFTNGTNGDIVGKSAQLASSPADNGNTVATAGGPPQTLALSTTSPALYAASSSGCATVGNVDERSMTRPGNPGKGCDIGAFELQFRTLTVTVKGSGTVSGNGISCPGTCSASYPETTKVSLTAKPGVDTTFTGWSGDCTGTSACSLTMSANHAVTATFVTNYRLTVTVKGSGKVTGGGISCRHTCSKTYSPGATITLHAHASAGHVFAGWSGACGGTGACHLTMNGNRSVRAKFVATLKLTVSPASATAKATTCFSFTATSRRHGVGGVTISVGGHTAKTSRHGTATVCVAFSAAGVYSARATKSGYRAAVASIHVTAAPKFTG